MKRSNKQIIITVIGLLFISLQSCQRLSEYEPLFSLDADTAISDEASAELALTGIYSTFMQRSASTDISPSYFMYPDYLSGLKEPGAFSSTDPDIVALRSNDPDPEIQGIGSGAYKGLYDLVNRSNWFLNGIQNLEDSEFEDSNRKEQMIAEAKILRALGNFYILRSFAQFYDTSSEYGIDIRKEPVRDGEAQPRQSVADTYDFILSDLEEAIPNAPHNRGKMYVNQTFAKALRAKVLLYEGNYPDAADAAQEVIDNGDPDFQLDPSYSHIFEGHDSPDIFDRSEILFGTSGDSDNGTGIGNFNDGLFAIESAKVKDIVTQNLNINGQNIIIDNKRFNEVFFPDAIYDTGGYWTSKHKDQDRISGDFEMIYHMRMAEVYLIFAEADARAHSSVTPEALQALNRIRERAGATTTGNDGFETYPASIDYQQFLKAVRLEKIAELQAETGEDWYDLVRYDYADGFGTGFQVSDVKSTATDPDHFILPIPQQSIDASNSTIKQNPGY